MNWLAELVNDLLLPDSFEALDTEDKRLAAFAEGKAVPGRDRAGAGSALMCYLDRMQPIQQVTTTPDTLRRCW